jgi:hypothetical protein
MCHFWNTGYGKHLFPGLGLTGFLDFGPYLVF